MADYWKSQPRKFCEICGCWFGDNKASIEFHERGKRHKENVQKKLKEARLRASDKEKELSKTAKTLEAIERAAQLAYQRDLEVKAGLPLSREAVLPKEGPQPQPMGPESIGGQSEIAKEKEKIEKAVRKVYLEIKAEQEQKKQLAQETAPPPPSPWQQMTTPEGYVYYYNTVTGVSQWPPLPDDPQPSHSTQQEQQGSNTAEALGDPTSAGEATVPLGQKRSAGEADVERPETHQPPKRAGGPYGSWTTVTVRPQQVAEEKEESESEEKHNSSDNEDEEHKGLKFKEKQAPVSSSSGPGSFTSFSFKKRTGARPQIRQRTSGL